MKKSHPAKLALQAFHKRNPEIHKLFDQVAFGQRPDGVEMPSHILLPQEVYLALTLTANGLDHNDFAKRQREVITLADEVHILTNWGKTQGIYRFDPDIYSELANAPLEGEIPVHLLSTLPEWCIFIETPGIALSPKSQIAGVWVANTFSMGAKGSAGKQELQIRFLIESATAYADDLQRKQVNIRLPLDSNENLQDIVAKHYQSAVQQLGPAKAFDMNQELVETQETLRQVITTALNLTLYICTQNDLRSNTGETQPTPPAPKRTKSGVRLFIPDQEKEWSVGTRMGTAIRAATAAMTASDTTTPTGLSIRPHIRRAHWHSFRIGKTKDDLGQAIPTTMRDLRVKWIPSVPVNLPDNLATHDLPAIIHRASK